MKTWGSGGVAPPFFTLAVDGDEFTVTTYTNIYKLFSMCFKVTVK
jgi:hypothetical protein